MLVTPRHAVQMKWNVTALSKTRGLELTLIICLAFDTVQEHQLNLEKKAALATKPKKGSKNKHTNRWITDEVALGTEVIIMFNVSTELDLANGARGYIADMGLMRKRKRR